MNDIVARLRAEFYACTCSGFNDCDCERCHNRPKCDLYNLVGQAADEIEMLHRLLQEQIAATRHMINAHEKRETELLLQLEQA